MSLACHKGASRYDLGMTDSSATNSLNDEEIAFLHSIFDLAREGSTEKLMLLIDQGIPADLTDPKGDTLLILAAYNGHNDTVAGLLEQGADINRLNDKGQGALTCAVFRQDEALTRLLLSKGADPHLGAQNAVAVAKMFELPELAAVIEEYL